jgi:exopolysaccharide biosynthesis polyprenyl glycosylphosphotransferase
MLRREHTGYILLSIVLDMLCTLAALDVARVLRDALPYGKDIPITLETPPLVIALTLVIWFGVYLIFNVYDARRSAKFLNELQNVLAGSLFALLVIAGTLYFSFRDVSRLFVLYFFALNLVLVVGWRLCLRVGLRLVGKDPTRRPHRVLIVGAGELGQQIAAMFREHGQAVIGFVEDDAAARRGQGAILGPVRDIATVVREQRVDDVIITLPYQAYGQLEPLILALQKFPVQVSIAPDYFNLVLYRATVQDVGGVPLIHLRDPALSGYQRLVKRGFDLIVGTVSLVMSLPIMALVAVIIKLDSPGAAIFRQKRVGENGRLFTMYKFRTMIEDAEQLGEMSPKYIAAGHVVRQPGDDPRLTRVGFFLRRTSLDELPQLFNVLKGDMSLVGPRPEMPWLVDKYEPWQHKRFAIPQGMTGWWQINGRSDKPMHLHTEDDLYYIQNYSLLLDILILWRTIFAVIRRKGAY